jgi:hypothetical protein
MVDGVNRARSVYRALVREPRSGAGAGTAAVRLFEAMVGGGSHATAGQYARERVDISYSAPHMTLARRAVREPAVRCARCRADRARGGAAGIGENGDAEDDPWWVAHAEQRTIKHLNEEVKAAELIARMTACGEVEPPDDELLSAVQEIESAVVSGRVYREGLRRWPRRARCPCSRWAPMAARCLV